ncbi:type IV pilus modification PilV family protein [Methylobacterium marchantiae]|uniref:Prepilin-type N-terminal cleavage/methylation domain-containing protein n=1 Tax=Methylobacterium marchantiae TaxID=600331 RepID=A0ABW3X3D7_9HYPH|nr:hypothetical protein AIGOOFII_4098 [Methylobacterium marchantiae]
MFIDRALPNARRRAGSGAGFTLVEALVALTVLAAVSPALFRMAVMLRAGTEAIDDRTRSEIVARSLLDTVLGRCDTAQSSLSGSTDGRRWSVEARLLDGEVRRVLAGTGRRSGTDRKPGQDEPPKAEATSGQPDRKADEDLPWMPVSVTIRVETMGRPLRIETVILARKAAS